MVQVMPLNSRLGLFLFAFILSAYPSVCHGKKKNKQELYTESYFKKIRQSMKGKELRQCQFVSSPGYFSSITESLQDPKQFASPRNTTLDIYNSKARIESSLILETNHSSINPFKKEPNFIFVNYTVSKKAKSLLLCRASPNTGNKDLQSFAELEYWNLKTKNKVNIFKLGRKNCEGKLYLNEETHRAAYIAPNGSLKIWDLTTGLTLLVPSSISKRHCQELDSSLNTAFCYNEDRQLAAYHIDSGDLFWKATRPDDFKPASFESYILKGLAYFKLELPAFLYKNYLSLPQVTSLDPKSKVLTTMYRFPNRRRDGKQQIYQNRILQHSIEDGRLITDHSYVEHHEVHLSHPRVLSSNRQIIAENNAIVRDDYKSFFVVDFKNKGKSQFGAACSTSWDLIPDKPSILSCGFCDKKTKISVTAIK